MPRSAVTSGRPMHLLLLLEALFEFAPLLAADDVALAISGAAEAGMIRVTIDIEAVVEREFLAGLDIVQGMNDDLATDDPSLAIRVA